MSQVDRSSEFDAKAADLDDEQLLKAAKLLNLGRLADSADIPQFLATAREAAERTTTLRPFDVQLQGALRMLAGDVVEMATGEGKTLSGAIAAAGYAIGGHNVHVITINDYLARRDAEWMGPLIEALGLTVGWITADSTAEERRAAYKCNVTYGSVNEIGFDVLRDQLVTDVADLVSPNPDVALIDEADSVLVDEALVPLVLAGTTHRETPKVEIIRLVGELVAGKDYDTDSDGRNVHLTETGAQKLEAKLGGIDLYSEDHVGTTLTEVNVALHAHVLLQRDVHYIVRDDAVHLINASRGRIAQLQRWPDGLQAAVEAKEGIETTETGEVLDTITVQALINRYPTVCGMTGTALAAGEQLRQFYKLGVSPIAPNTPNIREDEEDRVYITAAAKGDAIVEHIKGVHETKQPVLVGTRDVAESEELHERLVKAGVPAVVLNAKNDAEEAAVIAEAGKLGSVTVSTQIAGRGTDIRLGGSDEADHDEVVLREEHVGGRCIAFGHQLVAELGVTALAVLHLDSGLLGECVDPLLGERLVLGVVDQQLVALTLARAGGPCEHDGDGRHEGGDPAPTGAHPGGPSRANLTLLAEGYLMNILCPALVWRRAEIGFAFDRRSATGTSARGARDHIDRHKRYEVLSGKPARAG